MPLLGGLILLGAFVKTAQGQRGRREQRHPDHAVRLAHRRHLRHLGRARCCSVSILMLVTWWRSPAFFTRRGAQPRHPDPGARGRAAARSPCPRCRTRRRWSGRSSRRCRSRSCARPRRALARSGARAATTTARSAGRALLAGDPVRQQRAGRVPAGAVARVLAAAGDRAQRLQHDPVAQRGGDVRVVVRRATPRRRPSRRPAAPERSGVRRRAAGGRTGRPARASPCPARARGRTRRCRPRGTRRRSRPSRWRTRRSGTRPARGCTISVISNERMRCSAIQSSVSGGGQ